MSRESRARPLEAWKGWQDADPEMLEPFYSKWVGLLTSEGLHAKADIATVLALLDQRIHKAEGSENAALDLLRLAVAWHTPGFIPPMHINDHWLTEACKLLGERDSHPALNPAAAWPFPKKQG